MHRLTNTESTWEKVLRHNYLCVNLFNSFLQTWRQQKPIHEQMPIMTFSKRWSFTGNQADALSTKPCFQTLAVLRLWKADRSAGECDTYCLARGPWGSFNKHPLEKERENVGYSSFIWSMHKSTDYGVNGEEGLDHSQRWLWVWGQSLFIAIRLRGSQILGRLIWASTRYNKTQYYIHVIIIKKIIQPGSTHCKRKVML